MPDDKVDIKEWGSGVDVLGAVLFPWGKVPRRRLRVRAERVATRIKQEGYRTDFGQSAVSYLGLLRHTKSFMPCERLRTALGTLYY